MFDFLRKRDECSCTRPYGSSARICQHLATGTQLGWYFCRDASAPDAPWPDAWCDHCQHAVAPGGQGPPAQVVFTTVCDGCYERHRERNWPPDTEGKLVALLEHARPGLIARQETLTAEHDLDQYDDFGWQRSGAAPRLMMSAKASGRGVAVDVTHVGSHSTRSGTWIWSWGHGEISEAEKAPVRAVRTFGEAHRVLKLATPHWPAKPPDAWDMVAVASHFIACQGTLRVPHEHGHNYFLVQNVEPLVA